MLEFEPLYGVRPVTCDTLPLELSSIPLRAVFRFNTTHLVLGNLQGCLNTGDFCVFQKATRYRMDACTQVAVTKGTLQNKEPAYKHRPALEREL
jgi:hypothetical protein